MTRPLRYDDAFVNILKEKMFEKFLGLFTVKVQSTTFFQMYNLQKGLLISSLYDIIYGIIITILLFTNYNNNKTNTTFLMESSLGVLSIFFGLIGLDSALNLKKVNSYVYKNWRIINTMLFILLEIGNHFRFICFYSESYHIDMSCSTFERGLFFLLIVIWNGYITKIAWSFFIRLDQSHDLLIIHGKYLEKMLSEENFKFDANKKYVPPYEGADTKLLVHKAGSDANMNDNKSDDGMKRNNELGKNKINIDTGSSNNTKSNPKPDNKSFGGKTNDFRLFKNESQITTGGNIRDSLKKDIKEN